MISKQKYFSVKMTMVVLCVSFTAIYAGRIMGQFQHKVGSVTQERSASQTEDVPDSVVNDIANRVGNVAGVEELSVMPASTGKGYSVNTQINLGNTTTDAPGSPEKIQYEVGKYFADVFSANHNIVDAEVYFVTNGRIVASAGLGSKVFQKLSLATGTGMNNVVTSMEQLPVVNGSGDENCWFEIVKMD